MLITLKLALQTAHLSIQALVEVVAQFIYILSTRTWAYNFVPFNTHTIYNRVKRIYTYSSKLILP